MSRLGKRKISIPKEVSVSINEGNLAVKGPHGELSRHFRDEIEIAVHDNAEITLTDKKVNNLSRALWGTYASHIRNMLDGVSRQFEKKLIIEGVGYRFELSGNELVLHVGFSHPVKIAVPEGVALSLEKNILTIRGADKEQIGSFAADVRSTKKPEPYKGKGIRYENEIIRRKQGKKAVA